MDQPDKRVTGSRLAKRPQQGPGGTHTSTKFAAAISKIKHSHQGFAMKIPTRLTYFLPYFNIHPLGFRFSTTMHQPALTGAVKGKELKGKGKATPLPVNSNSTGTSSSESDSSSSASDSAPESDSDDELITPEYLESLLQKARQNANKRQRMTAADDESQEDEVINLAAEPDQKCVYTYFQMLNT
jgi:hypothetical protein